MRLLDATIKDIERAGLFIAGFDSFELARIWLNPLTP